MNKHIFKEYLADIIYKFKASIPAWREIKEQSTLRSLVTKGYVIIPSMFEESECNRMVDSFNEITSRQDCKDVWRDAVGADTRLFSAEKYSEVFKTCLNNPILQGIKRQYMGANLFNRFDYLMVNRILPVKDNLGSGGGWHRDSPYSKQLKAIAYLSDVSEENGPFQFVEGTHTLSSCLALYRAGLTKSGQYRFEQHEINSILDNVGRQRLVTVTGAKGDCIIVNTKAIHRGMPIAEGERYAMTYYFEAGQIN